MVPNADRLRAGSRASEYRHHGANAPVSGRFVQMSEESFGYLLLCGRMSGINEIKCIPEQASDTAAIVAPSRPRAILAAPPPYARRSRCE